LAADKSGKSESLGGFQLDLGIMEGKGSCI